MPGALKNPAATDPRPHGRIDLGIEGSAVEKD